MILKEYILAVKKTESKDFEIIASRLDDRRALRLLHSAMGLSTEANEILDHLKKVIFYGKIFDAINTIEELGDLLWYIALACDELGISIETVMQKNINKLEARYKNHNFNEKNALYKDLNVERSILETDIKTRKINVKWTYF